MSYEGYVQTLCAEGHYTMFDAHEELSERCDEAECTAPIIWENGVDETNGDDPKTGQGYGFIELEEVAGPTLCPTCHQEVGAPRYKIPPKGVGIHKET